MKIIKVYYKGTCQEFNASDGTTEEEIFKLMKRIFRIKEDIYDFFLQDSEGRVLIIPKILPEELSVYLYVRSNDGIPDISNKNVNEKSVSTENINKEEDDNDSFFNFNTNYKNTRNDSIFSFNDNDVKSDDVKSDDVKNDDVKSDDVKSDDVKNDDVKSEESNSTKSKKWIFKCYKGTEAQLVDGTHYYNINSPKEDSLPCVISSIEFSKGKNYCVIKVDSHGCGRVGLGTPDQPMEYFSPRCQYRKYEGPYTYVREADCDQLTKLTGIAIDCVNKNAYFLKVNPETFKPIKIIKKVKNLPKSVIIFAAFKGFIQCLGPSHTGITLIKDSLPFPDLEGLSDYEGDPWEEENKDLIKHN